jgi:hypothetical protein
MALNKDIISQRFVEAMGYESSRRAHLGNPENFGARPATILARVNYAMGDSISRLNALEHDQTRPSAPQKHQAAQVLAKATVAEFQKARRELAAHSQSQMEKGFADAAAILSDRPGPLASEIRAHLKSKVGDAKFAAELPALVKSNADVAAAILNAPAFLSGMSDERQSDLRIHAVTAHAPEAAALIAEAVEVQALDGKLAKIEAGIHSAFYNGAIAAGMNTRVDVEAPPKTGESEGQDA